MGGNDDRGWKLDDPAQHTTEERLYEVDLRCAANPAIGVVEDQHRHVAVPADATKYLLDDLGSIVEANRYRVELLVQVRTQFGRGEGQAQPNAATEGFDAAAPRPSRVPPGPVGQGWLGILKLPGEGAEDQLGDVERFDNLMRRVDRDMDDQGSDMHVEWAKGGCDEARLAGAGATGDGDLRAGPQRLRQSGLVAANMEEVVKGNMDLGQLEERELMVERDLLAQMPKEVTAHLGLSASQGL